jgi:hypothetical protein
MILNELKSVIAQNCEEYYPYNTLYKMSAGANRISCANCTNYIGEKCAKDLHDNMKLKLSRN